MKFFDSLKRYTDRAWYAPLLGFLASIDYFVMVVPTDALVTSAIALNPKRKHSIVSWAALGSGVGAFAFWAMILRYGLAILDIYFPTLRMGWVWSHSADYVQAYGGWGLLLMSASPLINYPAVIVATLAAIPGWQQFLWVVVGRYIKYSLYGFLVLRARDRIEKRSEK